MDYESQVQSGSPEKWIKKNLPKYLCKKFFIGLILAIPCFWLWGDLIYFMCTVNEKCSGHGTDSFSASFGRHGIMELKLKKSFCIIYLITILAVCLTVCLLGFHFNLGALKIFIIGAAINFTIIQLHGLSKFKTLIYPYACPKCGMVNSQKCLSTSNYVSREVDRVVGTKGGGTVKTGTVYVDGREAGSVYESSPTYNVYQRYEEEKWEENLVCSNCSYKHSETQSRSTKKGDKHY